MKKLKFPPLPRAGDIIRIKQKFWDETDGYEEHLKKHAALIVARVDHRPECISLDFRARFTPVDGGIAMTEWVELYDDEFEIDPFLTAVHKAQKSGK